MKKCSSALLAILMVLSCVIGCTNNANINGLQTGYSNLTSDTLKIGFSISERDQFLTKMENALTAYAESKNVEIIVFDSQQDIQKQLEHITTFAMQGFDAIIVNLVDQDTADTIMSNAKDIPVIFVNRMPDESVLLEGRSAYVGSDESQAGLLQAEYLTEYFNGKNVTTIDYILLMGILGLPHTTKRTEFVKKGLEESGFTLNQIFEDTALYDRAKAMSLMQQFLGTGKEFDVVISNNDEMALGAIEALKAVGKTDIPVVGIDATENALAAIQSGDMAATVFQNAQAQAEGAVDAAIALAKGEAIELIIIIPYELVTKDNVEEYIGR